MVTPTMYSYNVEQTGLHENVHVHYQLPPEVLTEQTVNRGDGSISNSGALCINTGEFTGRSPKDRFIVEDEITVDTVNWNNINQPIDENIFFNLKKKMLGYLNSKEEVWVRDCYACAEKTYRLNIRVINENAWSNLFAYNMFLRPAEEDLENFQPDWQIIQAPGFKATPLTDGTKNPNFTIISFKHKTILIGGSGYTGEIKKGIFSVLNFLLPIEKNVLSMHCSANQGSQGDVALFFGLSGTGKTTLSTDPERKLIGDDEHGWNDNSVFNFEGGCYAKCIGLHEEKEPEIYRAIHCGALVENTTFIPGTNSIDFDSTAITENTRVSYPLFYISNALEPAVGNTPDNIFFLTCDAYGVLPPVSKLTASQAMYQFISGYTAKVAGTEEGIKEPRATFSACFGAPFLPLHPAVYARMLGERIRKHEVKVWLINTGWTGGGYSVGRRMKLSYTRAMIKAALKGDLDKVDYIEHPVFEIQIPVSCPNVPTEILDPRNTWQDKVAYDEQAKNLAKLFIENFSKFREGTDLEVYLGAPLAD